MDFKAFEGTFEQVKQSVEFVDVKDQYDCSKDLTCKYEFQGYKPHEGDKVAIYKVGWFFMKDSICFEAAPLTQKVNPSSSLGCFYVTFKSDTLPKDTTELYQFCYISNKNELYGASSAFKFTESTSQNFPRLFELSSVKKPLVVSSSILKNASQNFPTPAKKTTAASGENEEIEKLKEENLILKEAVKAMICQKNETSRSHGNEMLDLKKTTDNLKRVLRFQQEEIDKLESKVKEVVVLYRRLQLENVELRKNYHELKESLGDLSKKGLEHSEISSEIPDFVLGDLEPLPYLSLPPLPLSIQLSQSRL